MANKTNSLVRKSLFPGLILIVIIFFVLGLAIFKMLSDKPCSIKDTKPIMGPLGGITDYQKGRLEKCSFITIFIKEGTDEDQVRSYVNELKEEKGVYHIDYKTASDAREAYLRNNKDPKLLELVPSDTFVSQINVYSETPEIREAILKTASVNSIVSNIVK